MDHQDLKLKQPNLPLLLLRGRERLLSYFRPILNAHGLTEQQWRILRVLLEGALEPRQICEVCCISSPSLVGVLTRMRQLGLINRSPVAHDQRRVLVSPTPRARRLAAAIIPEIQGAYREIDARVGKSFLRQLNDTVVELLAVLEPRFPEGGESESPTGDTAPKSQGKSKRSARSSAAIRGTGGDKGLGNRRQDPGQ